MSTIFLIAVCQLLSVLEVHGQFVYSTELSDTSIVVIEEDPLTGVSSILANIGANPAIGRGEITLSGTRPRISLNTLQIENKGSAKMGIDGDIIPFSSVTYDLGNNLSTEHWDDVVALQFITYVPPPPAPTTRVKRIDSSLKSLLSLHPIRYKSISGKEHITFSMKELKRAVPEVVVNEDWDYDQHQDKLVRHKTRDAINYDAFIPLLISALQEQQVQIENLQSTIDELKQKIASN